MAPDRASIANSELERSFPATIRCVDDYFVLSTRGDVSRETTLTTTEAVIETDQAATPTTVTEAVQNTTDAPTETTQSENK